MAEVIYMPKLSDTMTTGTLVRWLKKEGDMVASGDMLAEVETDKATMEVENFVPGILLKCYLKAGAVVPIGGPICVIGQKGEAIPDVGSAGDGEPKEEEKAVEKPVIVKKEEPKKKEVVKEEKPKAVSVQKVIVSDKKETSCCGSKVQERIKASPLAKKVAEELGVNLSRVVGSGPEGRIVRADVVEASAKGSHGGQCGAGRAVIARGEFIQEEEQVEITGMRSVIAKRLLESKTQIPHFYLEIEVNANALLQVRESVNHYYQETEGSEAVKLTVNDFILKAVAEALRRVPEVNVSWDETHITRHGSAHLSFGVAVEEGLVTPVIRDAQNKSLKEISVEAKELIHKAKGKKLKPQEMTGSTFTITNLGMFGITKFYGIINPPNAAILSVGSTVKKPIVDGQNAIGIGQMMTLGLSGDHRVIDGAVAARFLNALKQVIETPIILVL